MALHIERYHGADGPRYIAEQIGRNSLAEEQAGVDLWREVARRYEDLKAGARPN